MRLRVNGVYNKSDGWVKDAATGQDLWPEDNWALRAALRWDIGAATSATLTWDHDDLDQLARPAIGLTPVAAGDTTVPYPADPDTFLDPRKAPVFNDSVGHEESRSLDGLNLIIDHEFGWGDFRSTTAWRQFETVNREDEDGTNFIATYFDTANVEDNDSWYQEFKFSGDSDRLDWVAGVSYYSEDARQASDTHAFTDSIDTLGVNLGIYEAAGLLTPDGTLYGFTSAVLDANSIPLTMLGLPWREVMNNEGDFTATAAFGDVIWHLNDKTNLTVGLRYTHDSKEFSWRNGPHETPELDETVATLQAIGFKVTRNGTDLSGEPTGEPYLSAALGASYVWMLGSNGDLDLSGRYAFRGESRCNQESKQQGTCQISPSFDVGEDQHRLDVRLAWSSDDDRWGVAAFVTNVLDDQYVTGVNNLTNDTFGAPSPAFSGRGSPKGG